MRSSAVPQSGERGDRAGDAARSLGSRSPPTPPSSTVRLVRNLLGWPAPGRSMYESAEPQPLGAHASESSSPIQVSRRLTPAQDMSLNASTWSCSTASSMSAGGTCGLESFTANNTSLPQRGGAPSSTVASNAPYHIAMQATQRLLVSHCSVPADRPDGPSKAEKSSATTVEVRNNVALQRPFSRLLYITSASVPYATAFFSSEGVIVKYAIWVTLSDGTQLLADRRYRDINALHQVLKQLYTQQAHTHLTQTLLQHMERDYHGHQQPPDLGTGAAYRVCLPSVYGLRIVTQRAVIDGGVEEVAPVGLRDSTETEDYSTTDRESSPGSSQARRRANQQVGSPHRSNASSPAPQTHFMGTSHKIASAPQPSPSTLLGSIRSAFTGSQQRSSSSEPCSGDTPQLPRMPFPRFPGRGLMQSTSIRFILNRRRDLDEYFGALALQNLATPVGSAMDSSPVGTSTAHETYSAVRRKLPNLSPTPQQSLFQPPQPPFSHRQGATVDPEVEGSPRALNGFMDNVFLPSDEAKRLLILFCTSRYLYPVPPRVEVALTAAGMGKNIDWEAEMLGGDDAPQGDECDAELGDGGYGLGDDEDYSDFVRESSTSNTPLGGSMADVSRDMHGGDGFTAWNDDVAVPRCSVGDGGSEARSASPASLRSGTASGAAPPVQAPVASQLASSNARKAEHLVEATIPVCFLDDGFMPEVLRAYSPAVLAAQLCTAEHAAPVGTGGSCPKATRPEGIAGTNHAWGTHGTSPHTLQDAPSTSSVMPEFSSHNHVADQLDPVFVALVSPSSPTSSCFPPPYTATTEFSPQRYAKGIAIPLRPQRLPAPTLRQGDPPAVRLVASRARLSLEMCGRWVVLPPLMAQPAGSARGSPRLFRSWGPPRLGLGAVPRRTHGPQNTGCVATPFMFSSILWQKQDQLQHALISEVQRELQGLCDAATAAPDSLAGAQGAAQADETNRSHRAALASFVKPLSNTEGPATASGGATWSSGLFPPHREPYNEGNLSFFRAPRDATYCTNEEWLCHAYGLSVVEAHLLKVLSMRAYQHYHSQHPQKAGVGDGVSGEVAAADAARAAREALRHYDGLLRHPHTDGNLAFLESAGNFQSFLPYESPPPFHSVVPSRDPPCSPGPASVSASEAGRPKATMCIASIPTLAIALPYAKLYFDVVSPCRPRGEEADDGPTHVVPSGADHPVVYDLFVSVKGDRSEKRSDVRRRRDELLALYRYIATRHQDSLPTPKEAKEFFQRHRARVRRETARKAAAEAHELRAAAEGNAPPRAFTSGHERAQLWGFSAGLRGAVEHAAEEPELVRSTASSTISAFGYPQGWCEEGLDRGSVGMTRHVHEAVGAEVAAPPEKGPKLDTVDATGHTDGGGGRVEVAGEYLLSELQLGIQGPAASKASTVAVRTVDDAAHTGISEGEEDGSYNGSVSPVSSPLFHETMWPPPPPEGSAGEGQPDLPLRSSTSPRDNSTASSAWAAPTATSTSHVGHSARGWRTRASSLVEPERKNSSDSPFASVRYRRRSSTVTSTPLHTIRHIGADSDDDDSPADFHEMDADPPLCRRRRSPRRSRQSTHVGDRDSAVEEVEDVNRQGANLAEEDSMGRLSSGRSGSYESPLSPIPCMPLPSDGGSNNTAPRADGGRPPGAETWNATVAAAGDHRVPLPRDESRGVDETVADFPCEALCGSTVAHVDVVDRAAALPVAPLPTPPMTFSSLAHCAADPPPGRFPCSCTSSSAHSAPLLTPSTAAGDTPPQTATFDVAIAVAGAGSVENCDVGEVASPHLVTIARPAALQRMPPGDVCTNSAHVRLAISTRVLRGGSVGASAPGEGSADAPPEGGHAADGTSLQPFDFLAQPLRQPLWVPPESAGVEPLEATTETARTTITFEAVPTCVCSQGALCRGAPLAPPHFPPVDDAGASSRGSCTPSAGGIPAMGYDAPGGVVGSPFSDSEGVVWAASPTVPSYRTDQGARPAYAAPGPAAAAVHYVDLYKLSCGFHLLVEPPPPLP